MTSDREQQLIADANRGDAQAMESLYLEYRTWVYHVAYRYGGHEQDAHDVVQEVFKYFFSKFPGFKLTCQLKTFLYPVIKNKAIDQLRKKDRLVALNDQEDEIPARETRDEQSERRSAMELLADLLEDQREVLMARFVDGLQMSEIAERLNIPAGTVKSRIHHALKRLRKKFPE